MTDYNSYLNRLMVDCQKSVQCSYNQPQARHIHPQYLPTPPDTCPSFKVTRTTAPPPSVSALAPATAASPVAYKPRNLYPAATVPQPYVPNDQPSATAASQSDFHNNVPPGANALQFATPKNFLPPATTPPPPFVPGSQMPVVNPSSACPSPETHESATPIGQAGPRQDTRKGSNKEGPEKDSNIRYKNMGQIPIREELKARGLICHGPNADLVKRLVQDDKFQAKPRTAENYDTMDRNLVYSLCAGRFVSSRGTVSSLRNRLKDHDKRVNKIEAAVPRLSHVLIPSGPVSALGAKFSSEMLKVKPLVPTNKDEAPSVTAESDTVEGTTETVTPPKPIDNVKPEIMDGVLPDQPRPEARNTCRKYNRCCPLDTTNNEDSMTVTEPATTRSTRSKVTIETVTPPKSKNCVESETIDGMFLDRYMYEACDKCRRRKRRCKHHPNENTGSRRDIEPTDPMPNTCDVTAGVVALNSNEDSMRDTETTSPRQTPSKVTSESMVSNSNKDSMRDTQPKTLRLTTCKATTRTVTPPEPVNYAESISMDGMLSGHIVQDACDICRKSHRRCIHDMYGNEDPVKAAEPVIPRPRACKAYIKDGKGFEKKKPTPAVQDVTLERTTRLRLSQPRASSSPKDKMLILAAEDIAGARVTRSRVSGPKAPGSYIESKRLTQSGDLRKDLRREDNVPKARRSPLLYQPKDEISLLQICVKLKDVIGWGEILGFWNMVQDTLQLKTGKPFKKVSRHVQILIGKRRAEQRELESSGNISIARVSTGCRPLLDKLIIGDSRGTHVSPYSSSLSPIASSLSSTSSSLSSIASSLSAIEDEDDISIGQETEQQLDLDDSALESQKRSATDAWLDSSGDTMRRKKLKISTSELISDASKSSADSTRCWSLSGSSVTSESSIEDESEDGDEHGVKSGDYDSTSVKRGI